MNPVLVASYLITVVLILATLQLHMVGPAFIGLLVYTLSLRLSHRLSRHLHAKWARLLAVGVIASFIIAFFIITGAWLSHYFASVGSFQGLTERMADVLSDLRSKLPPQLLAYMPENILDLRDALVHWLRAHSQTIELAGRAGLHTLVHIIIVMVLAAMLALKHFDHKQNHKPLSRAIQDRLTTLTQAFESVVFAQARISAVNTLLTAVYLLVLLPLAGIHLPYAVTLVAITFFTGLIPIFGNLISNSLILLISLGISFDLALMSLLFLVSIHKLEYFINARIVGSRIHANAWELILAMLIMETIYGLPGLLIAPVVYAYLKFELKRLELV
ncbi:MAG TPA: AI-2E family transporter [Methylophilaceae bacterium]|nr:AI-2E family transporter [Methylophilaceae bacterium]